MAAKVNWGWVNEWKKDENPFGRKEDFQSMWIPFRLPEIVRKGDEIL